MYLRAHLGAFVLCVGFGGDGHPGNGDFLRQNGVNGAGKAELHRPAHLPAVEVPFTKVVITAPKVRISKKFWHMKSRTLRPGPGLLFFASFKSLPATPRYSRASLIAAVQGNAIFYIDAPAGASSLAVST